MSILTSRLLELLLIGMHHRTNYDVTCNVSYENKYSKIKDFQEKHIKC